MKTMLFLTAKQNLTPSRLHPQKQACSPFRRSDFKLALKSCLFIKILFLWIEQKELTFTGSTLFASRHVRVNPLPGTTGD